MLNDAFARMPHAGPMRLIDKIVAADEGAIHCVATDHRAASYPLRLDGVLYGCTLVELGAQAAAAHTSLFGIGDAHTGLVLALSNAEIGRDVVETQRRIEVHARRVQALDDAASYRFEVMEGADIIVSADVLLSMQRRTG